MEDRNNAVQKLEVAVDTVNAATRPDQQVPAGEEGDVKVTPIQVKQMMKSFSIFDSNNDNTLDSEELAQAFRVMGLNLTNKQLDDIVKEADVDKNGRVDEQEFIRLIMKHMQSREEAKKELRDAFAVFDTYGEGRVNQEELVKTLRLCGDPLTDKEASQLMSAMDTNKDGYIDINEFVNFLTKSIPIGYYTTNTG
ncbi:uncharacterized protein LOC123540996 isoform X1 [Mercenaria mercenaria]|uniref:uncharacterized protein LOC123540996 isoform X1 n=1 Tax=Mercenaria mercenaria TaxID=6596 RepID=UPI00234ECD79|nr:uncharacterized protein LOC123540996 isoform X1 [Mercenaria mercenaria]